MKLNAATILVRKIFAKFSECKSALDHHTVFLLLVTARFGKLATMKRQVRKIDVERLNPKLQNVNVIFTTLANAADLLQYDLLFISSPCSIA